MLDVVPPVVSAGGRGCLYTAEPTDGCPRNSEAVHQSMGHVDVYLQRMARHSTVLKA